jgi:UDP-N-acetylmuramoylalanine--D-glutamate ligase
MEIRDKHITVVGLGASGKAACTLLRRKGACVYATDTGDCAALRKTAAQLCKKMIRIDLGTCRRDVVEDSDIIVVSPGVRPDAEPLAIARDRSIPVISEIELASWFAQSDIIAVTGTNGKSTIVTLTGLMLRASGKDPVVCGNIGKAFSALVLSVKHHQPVILETSSFQLKDINRFRPRISLIANVTGNHLDMHVNFNDYFSAKKNIYRNQKEDDFCILNYDDKRLRHLRPKPNAKTYFYSLEKDVTGAFLDKDNFVININGEKRKICPVNDILIPGRHNLSDALAACCCAYLLGATFKGMRKALGNFKGLPHRCEHVVTLAGVRYIDDSKATSIGACASALRLYSTNIILIAGGRDKEGNFREIRGLVRRRVRVVVAIGEAADKIIHAFSGAAKTYKAYSMAEAVHIARDSSIPGDVVLLSPMCASFDMYKSYADRGVAFKKAVLRLAGD